MEGKGRIRIENVRVLLSDKIHKDGNGVFHGYLFMSEPL